jgi:hypothetical protein
VNSTLDIKENDEQLSSFEISTCELSWVMGMLAVSIADFVVCFCDHIESTMFCLLPNFTQNLLLIHCSCSYSDAM